MPRSNRNKINLSGLVVAEPELTVENGSDVLHMEVRSRRYRRRRGELAEYYDFLNVDVHGPTAKRTDGLVCNGMVVDITGRVEARDRPVLVDGECIHDSEGKKVTYRAVRIVATRVKPLSSPAKAETQPSDDGQSDAPDGEGEEADSSPTGESQPEDGQQPAAPKVKATEGAIELAKERNIDLAKVEGHGQLVEGVATITKADVKAAVKTAEREAAEAAELRRNAAREVAGEGPAPAAQAS